MGLALAGLMTVGAVLPLPAVATANDDVTGWWYDGTKRGAILIEPCGDRLCGRVAWMREPLDEAGKIKLDYKNPDEKLRTRTICQMTMMGGFSKSADKEWDGGWIYNPEDGDTYKSRMVLQDDGTLRVRGYIGVPWLGKSQIWTRPEGPLQECKPG